MKIEDHFLVFDEYDRDMLEYAFPAIIDLINLANEYDYTLDYLISLLAEYYRFDKEIPKKIYLD